MEKDDDDEISSACSYEEFTNDIDIEDHIIVHTINKNNQVDNEIPSKCKNSSKLSQYLYNVPILVCDIQKIEKLDSNDFGLSSFCGVNFKTVTIYGRAIPITMKMNKNNYWIKIYQVDDGTGSIRVQYSIKLDKYHQKLTELNNLSYELDLYKKECKKMSKLLNLETQQNLTNLIKGMDVFLNKTKKNTFESEDFMKRIVKCSVIGIPYKYNNDKEFSLKAIEFLEHKDLDGSKEIFFKEHLIRHYRRNVKLSS